MIFCILWISKAILMNFLFSNHFFYLPKFINLLKFYILLKKKFTNATDVCFFVCDKNQLILINYNKLYADYKTMAFLTWWHIFFASRLCILVKKNKFIFCNIFQCELRSSIVIELMHLFLKKLQMNHIIK